MYMYRYMYIYINMHMQFCCRVCMKWYLWEGGGSRGELADNCQFPANSTLLHFPPLPSKLVIRYILYKQSNDWVFIALLIENVPYDQFGWKGSPVTAISWKLRLSLIYPSNKISQCWKPISCTNLKFGHCIGKIHIWISKQINWGSWANIWHTRK